MDRIANLFTTIENARRAKKLEVTVPCSSHLVAILEVLKQNDRIKDFKVGKGQKATIDIKIVQTPYKFQRISKLSRRLYSGSKRLPISTPYSLVIVSTPFGVMTSNEARKKKIGGELIGVVQL